MAKLTNNERSPYTDVIRLTATDLIAIGNGGTRQIATIPAGGAVSLCAITETIAVGYLPKGAASTSTPVYIKVTDAAVASITAGEILIGLAILDLTQYQI